MSYHYTNIEIVKPRALKTLNAGEDMERQELSYIADRNTKWYDHFGRHFISFIQN